jgi:hypothetical protein
MFQSGDSEGKAEIWWWHSWYHVIAMLYSGGLSAFRDGGAPWTPRRLQPDVVRINTIESEERNDPDCGMRLFEPSLSNDMTVISNLSA